jgi:hypothetical protein
MCVAQFHKLICSTFPARFGRAKLFECQKFGARSREASSKTGRALRGAGGGGGPERLRQQNRRCHQSHAATPDLGRICKKLVGTPKIGPPRKFRTKYEKPDISIRRRIDNILSYRKARRRACFWASQVFEPIKFPFAVRTRIDETSIFSVVTSCCNAASFWIVLEFSKCHIHQA